MIEAQEYAASAAAKEAKIKADQKSSKAAQEKSGLSVSAYVRQIEAAEAAKAAAAKAAASKPVTKVVGSSVTQRVVSSKTSAPAPGRSIRSYMAGGGMVSRFAGGGHVGYYPMGGLIPYKANGGLFQSRNTDSVAAMLTPGEFVVKRSAVEKFGVDSLKSINNGTYDQGSVYNYSVNVNVATNADSNAIARTVIAQIKQVDSQRIRGVRL
jgi:hypothetical protein